MAEAVRQMNPHRYLITINGGVRETDREWLRDLAIERQAENYTAFAGRLGPVRPARGSFSLLEVSWTRGVRGAAGVPMPESAAVLCGDSVTGPRREPPTADGGWRGCGYCTGVTTRSLPARAPPDRALFPARPSCHDPRGEAAYRPPCAGFGWCCTSPSVQQGLWVPPTRTGSTLRSGVRWPENVDPVGR